MREEDLEFLSSISQQLPVTQKRVLPPLTVEQRAVVEEAIEAIASIAEQYDGLPCDLIRLTCSQLEQEKDLYERLAKYEGKASATHTAQRLQHALLRLDAIHKVYHVLSHCINALTGAEEVDDDDS